MKGSLKNTLVKYFSRAASVEQMDVLARFLHQYPDDFDFKTLVRINYLIDINVMDFNTENEIASVFEKIKQRKREIRKKRTYRWFRYAAILIFGIVSYYFLYEFPFIKKEGISPEVAIKIEPGTDKAVLTLGNQTEVALEKGTQLNLKGVSLKGHQLIYDEHSHSPDNKLQYNYLAIPRGGQFHVQLSDGTRVWLNSESKLKYPARFIKGQGREVELLYGEAFFEVAPSAANGGAVFGVKTGAQQIEVLGTAFNVKAYKGEKEIASTLVEGKILLQIGEEVKTLNPKEQLVYHIEEDRINIRKVDKLFEAIAWKEGYFSFKEKSMEEIMEILSRWYDMSYEFENPDKRQLRFSGVLDRGSNISEILNYLKMTDEINFTIYEKTVTIK